MNKVSESIWSNEDVLIPMADVQHIEKVRASAPSIDGTFKVGDLTGILVITKHTRWDNSYEVDAWANSIYIPNGKGQAERFIKDFCFYRHELEGGAEAFKGPEGE